MFYYRYQQCHFLRAHTHTRIQNHKFFYYTVVINSNPTLMTLLILINRIPVLAFFYHFTLFLVSQNEFFFQIYLLRIDVMQVFTTFSNYFIHIPCSLLIHITLSVLIDLFFLSFNVVIIRNLLNLFN